MNVTDGFSPFSATVDGKHIGVMGAIKAARGFSLIEMLVAAALVAALAAIALPLAELNVKRDREAKLQAALREIRDAIDAYKQAVDQGRIASPADASGYPPRLEALVEGVDDARAPNGGRLYFLRRLPRDPMAADVHSAAAQTWALRSYDSPPEQPRPGRDVYDVYSRSDELALDGTRYRDW